MSSERTFIMVKPDGVQRSIVGEVIKRFEQKGFKLVAMKFLQAPTELLEEHYAEHKEKPFFRKIVKDMCSGPVVPMVWEGKNVIKTGRGMLGMTDPGKSNPGTIRGDFGIDVGRIYERGNSGPVCFFLHGGGFSGLSWAVLSKLLSELVTCRCVAMDLRGHGDTNTTDDSDLSADVLASDVGRVVEKLYGDNPPPIVLIGHSMGGAIAVHTVYKKTLPSICGLIVIDVVEGTAMEALSSMQSFLRSRPATFKSVESAIEYCCKSGQIRNMESAKVSVIGQLKRIDTNETATHEITHEHQDQTQIPVNSSRAHEAISEAISEADEEDDESAEPEPKKPSSGPPAATSNKDVEFKHPRLSVGGNQYAWRIDLTKTEVYWKGWFEGLSNMFLSCGTAKMLLCAGIDRLDKDMTVGQMQGKFQLELLPQCGHAVHEDCPEKVSDVLATFLIRNRLVEHSGIERRGIPF